MALMLNLFLVLSLCEFLVVSRFLQPVRKPLAALIALSLALVSGGVLGERFSLATALLSIISLYRVVNLLRVVQDRVNLAYLRVSVRRTTLSLLTLQIILLLTLAFADAHRPSSQIWWLILSVVTVAVAATITWATKHNLRTTISPVVNQHFNDSQLPSISVCIPARNETSALEACLRSLTASDYPKLEIIVLDDCSQGTRTSDIIRAFAHDGVRFIQGEVPADGWLAKNWAYQQLLEAASGEYVVFCGVDTRWEISALRSLVTTLIAKQKRMLSLMPINVWPGGFVNRLAALIQPARYAWELCLPRRPFNRPAVLSTTWIAERKLINNVGGFAAVRSTITPEAYFAKKAVLRDQYGFSRAGADLTVQSDKQLDSLLETAVRTRYPQLRRRPELVLIVSSIELTLVLAPFGLLAVGLFEALWIQVVCAAGAILLTGWCYGQVVQAAYSRKLLRGYVLAPIAVLLDVYLRHESLWRYEFGEINWKGRNVCLPVMRVIPRLPKL